MADNERDIEQTEVPAESLPEALRFKLDNLPKSPGVYEFKNAEGKIIYIGKAKVLRSRVRSYFQKADGSDPKKDVLVAKIADLEILVTDSEMEALLLENNLIKEHTPRYNVRLRDDKSYPHIVVTNEPFPRVFPTRRIIRDGSRYYGPYSDVKAMHLMLRTIRQIFPIRSCDYRLDDDMVAKRKVKVCLDYHIKKCQGPCEGIISRIEYYRIIQQAEQLLKGKTRALQHSIEAEMKHSAENLDFEKAADLRDRLHALQKYQDKQKIVASDFGDRDIIAIARKEGDATGVVFRVRDGKIVGRQNFVFSGAELESENEIMEHLIQRYYVKTMDIPPEIHVPFELEDEDALTLWLHERTSVKVFFAAPKIGEKAKLVRMCQTNARYLLDEILVQKIKVEDTVPHAVVALQRDLRLKDAPRRIECFDISHFQGAETVASMVTFVDGKAKKSEYRKFIIETVEGVDDFASMREVVSRRYRRVLEEGLPLPDLIMVDGGKGQLSAAVEALAPLDLNKVPIIGLAKRLEEVFVPNDSYPQTIPKTSSGLKLLQRVRDEAHRFAITFHRSRRDKSTLQTELEDISGIGAKRAKELLEKLGSVKAVRAASSEEIAAVVGWSAAKAVYAHFHQEEQALPTGELLSVVDEVEGGDEQESSDEQGSAAE